MSQSSKPLSSRYNIPFPSYISNASEPNPEEEETELGGMFDLTWRQRIGGFIACYIIGIALNVLAIVRMNNVTQFAILYSIGNVLSLFSTAFIVGLSRQVKSMFAPERLIAVIVFFAALGGTILAAIKDRQTWCAVMIIVQMIALLWYSLSYIPFARSFIISIFSCGSNAK